MCLRHLWILWEPVPSVSETILLIHSFDTGEGTAFGLLFQAVMNLAGPSTQGVVMNSLTDRTQEERTKKHHMAIWLPVGPHATAEVLPEFFTTLGVACCCTLH